MTMYERSPNCSGKLGEHYGNIRLRITENVYESFQRNWLLAYEGLLQILGDVDDEVAHALQRVQYIYVVDACLVIIRVVLGVIYLGIAEVVAQVVDAVLGIVGVGHLGQCALVGVQQFFYHGIVGIVHGIHHALEFLDGILIKSLV